VAIIDCLLSIGLAIGDSIVDWRLAFHCRLAIGDWIGHSAIPNPIGIRQSSMKSPFGNPLLNQQSPIDDSIGNLQSAIGN
jgi:hypothetical protein